MNGSGYVERRNSKRLDMEKQLITISWIETTGSTVVREVTCVDVSNGGLQVELDKPLPIDTTVVVIFNPNHPQCQSYETRVLRSVLQEHGWFNIGLQFITG